MLRIVTRLNVGGPTFHVGLLMRSLDPERFEQRLVHGRVEPGEDALVPDWAKDAVSIDALARGVAPLRDLTARAALLRAIRDFRPDIVHTHQGKAGYLGRMAAHAANVPVVCHTFHGLTFDGYFGPLGRKAVLFAERRAAAVSTVLIAQSAAQKVEITERLGTIAEQKTVVVEPAVDWSRLRRSSRARSTSEVPTLAFVGRFAPIKRPDVFLWMVKRVGERLGRPVRAIIAGGGPASVRAHLEDLARIWGLSDRVEFTGVVDDPSAVYDRADCSVITSRMEGTPQAMIESVGCGCPSVAFDIGGISDVARGTPLIATVPLDDMEGMAERIVATLTHPIEPSIAEMSAAAARERFAPRRLVGDLESVYLRLISESATRPK